jgi:hypothetical protein
MMSLREATKTRIITNTIRETAVPKKEKGTGCPIPKKQVWLLVVILVVLAILLPPLRFGV